MAKTLDINNDSLFTGESEAIPIQAKRGRPPKGEIMESKEIVEQPMEISAMMALAVKMGKDGIEILERLFAMKKEDDAIKSKREYDKHFAEMQAEFKPVERSKKGFNYMYAPLEDLQKSCGPIISKYGFSSSWNEEALTDPDKKNWKRVILVKSGWGHTETTYMDVPPLKPTGQMNETQAAMGQSTYGQRNTYKAGWGCIVDDEDNDATNPDDKPPSIAEQSFEKLMTYALKDKIGIYRQAWDEAELKDKFDTGKRIRQQLFDDLLFNMDNPDRSKALREQWGKAIKPQDYLDILEGIKRDKEK